MLRFPLFLPILACSTFLIAGALGRQGAAPALCGSHASPPEQGLPAANDLLAEASSALAPDHLEWLETAVWQQVQGEEGHYVARGRYLTAPGKRLRLELAVRVGKTEGNLLLVSDGQTARQVIRVGQADPVVSQRPLRPSAKSPEEAASCNSFPADLGAGGLDRILTGVRQHLTAPKVCRASWKGQAVFRIQGGWLADPARPGELPPGLRPHATPRTCVVWLDARTLWPHRLEWGGEGGRDTWQVEFRDPLLNQPLAPARCARLFAVTTPGN
jgi:hypothetical protein